MEKVIYLIPILVGGIPLAFSDDLLNRRSLFKTGFILSMGWFLFGAAIAFVVPTGSSGSWLLVTFLIPLVYLGCFEALRSVYFRIFHENPCITSISSRIGAAPLNGLLTQYPKDKRISGWDFAFTFAQVGLPIAVISILIWFLK